MSSHQKKTILCDSAFCTFVHLCICAFVDLCIQALAFVRCIRHLSKVRIVLTSPDNQTYGGRTQRCTTPWCRLNPRSRALGHFALASMVFQCRVRREGDPNECTVPWGLSAFSRHLHKQHLSFAQTAFVRCTNIIFHLHKISICHLHKQHLSFAQTAFVTCTKQRLRFAQTASAICTTHHAHAHAQSVASELLWSIDVAKQQMYVCANSGKRPLQNKAKVNCIWPK